MRQVSEQPRPATGQTASRGSKRKLAELACVFLIIAGGVSVRALHLDEHPFWVDEAESSINALTILQHGYPTDSYLGIPIYENSHVWLWPENPEYEFRDVSYSANHFAVYHGWLPLYAIAASFALHNIQPDHDDGTRTVKHNLEEQKRRTRAGRWPAVIFAAMFLAIVFLGGNLLYGREAGWAALITAAYYPYHIGISNQARYYSAQVTLTTACCVLLWLVIKECRWRHVWLAGAAFILLFHTHLLSFVTAAAMAALGMPVIIRRHRDWFRKMAAFAAVVAAGTLPWVIVTEFLGHPSRIPRAWPLLRIPADLLRYPPFNLLYAIPGFIILAIAAWVYLSRKKLSLAVSAPAIRLSPVLVFLGSWTAVGYATFLLFMPAASFAADRLKLSYWGPLFLLGSIMCATIAHIVAPRISRHFSPFLTSVLMLLIFLGTGHRLWSGSRLGKELWNVHANIFRHLDSMRLDSATKLYSVPNDHLVLSFYSGLPVQDMTPVRKSYLDSYPGDIVYIDPEVTTPTGILDVEQLREAATRSGLVLSPEAAEETATRLGTRPYRESILNSVVPGQPPNLEPLNAFEQGRLSAHRALIAAYFDSFGYELITRGFEIRDWSDWCAVLKYRFVDPEARRGIHANYAERLRGADAMIVAGPKPAAIYRSRWHPPHSTGSLGFRFVR